MPAVEKADEQKGWRQAAKRGVNTLRGLAGSNPTISLWHECGGCSMAKLEGVQTNVADIAVDVETATLSVYRAAWHRTPETGSQYPGRFACQVGSIYEGASDVQKLVIARCLVDRNGYQHKPH